MEENNLEHLGKIILSNIKYAKTFFTGNVISGYVSQDFQDIFHSSDENFYKIEENLFIQSQPSRVNNVFIKILIEDSHQAIIVDNSLFNRKVCIEEGNHLIKMNDLNNTYKLLSRTKIICHDHLSMERSNLKILSTQSKRVTLKESIEKIHNCYNLFELFDLCLSMPCDEESIIYRSEFFYHFLKKLLQFVICHKYDFFKIFPHGYFNYIYGKSLQSFIEEILSSHSNTLKLQELQSLLKRLFVSNGMNINLDNIKEEPDTSGIFKENRISLDESKINKFLSFDRSIILLYNMYKIKSIFQQLIKRDHCNLSNDQLKDLLLEHKIQLNSMLPSPVMHFIISYMRLEENSLTKEDFILIYNKLKSALFDLEINLENLV